MRDEEKLRGEEAGDAIAAAAPLCRCQAAGRTSIITPASCAIIIIIAGDNSS